MDQNKLAIDPHRLDEEWLTQPMLYEEAAQKTSDAMRQRDVAKTDLETLMAETAIDIRANPNQHGLEKVTETAVQEKIAVNELVIKAKKLLNSMSALYQQAKTEVDSVEMRKKALENLVSLYIGQYFSVPKEGKENRIEGGKRFIDQVKEEIRGEHVETLRQKKRERLGRFADPVTSPEEMAEKTDEERIDRLSPAAKEQVKELTGRRLRRRQQQEEA